MSISDWSSDVCSADLLLPANRLSPPHGGHRADLPQLTRRGGAHQRLATSSLLIHRRATASALDRATGGLPLHPPPLRRTGRPCRPPGRITHKRFEIGSASCRERVCQYV